MDILVFAENMKCLRENILKVNQTEIADRLGFSTQKWNNYERGISFPKLEDLEKISKYFGILESDLFYSELYESDFKELYQRYTQVHKDETTPPSDNQNKPFLASIFTIAPPSDSDSATVFVTKPVTNAAEKGKKYVTTQGYSNGNILREEGAKYGNKSTDARIAQLEADVNKIKAFLASFKP